VSAFSEKGRVKLLRVLLEGRLVWDGWASLVYMEWT